MTEDEAKTKWCPMFRVTAYELDAPQDYRPQTDNRGRHAPEGNCLGSGCMAWRVYSVDDRTRENGPQGGYCGLAGKP